MIRVYAPAGSGYSRRVRIALLEKAIPHESVPIALRQGEHKRPEFLALNPHGRVPVLVDDDFVLYESRAILAYLEATHPERPLLPAAPRSRARVEMYLNLCDLQFARHTSVISVPRRFLPPDRWPLEAMAAARVEIVRHLDILEQALTGHDYLVDDVFTLAEVAYLPFLDLLPMLEVVPPPAVAAWTARLLARPSAVATAHG
jgi:glutathione S-transferase